MEIDQPEELDHFVRRLATLAVKANVDPERPNVEQIRLLALLDYEQEPLRTIIELCVKRKVGDLPAIRSALASIAGLEIVTLESILDNTELAPRIVGTLAKIGVKTVANLDEAFRNRQLEKLRGIGPTGIAEAAEVVRLAKQNEESVRQAKAKAEAMRLQKIIDDNACPI